MPEASPLADRLKELDRPTLLQVQSEVVKLLHKMMPKGAFARYRVAAVGNQPATTYDLLRVRCGRENCRKCVDGGHGPYWYCYWTSTNGKRKYKYIGRELPAEVLATGTSGDYTPTSGDEPLDAIEALPRKPVGRRVFRRKK